MNSTSLKYMSEIPRSSMTNYHENDLNNNQKNILSFRENLMADMDTIDSGIEKQRLLIENEKNQKLLDAANQTRFLKSEPLTGRPPFAPGLGSTRYFSEVKPLERGKYQGGTGEVVSSIVPDRSKAVKPGCDFDTMFTPIDLFEKAFERLRPTQKLRVCGKVVMDNINRNEAYWKLEDSLNEDVRAYMESGEYKRTQFERTMLRSKGFNKLSHETLDKKKRRAEKTRALFSQSNNSTYNLQDNSSKNVLHLMKTL
eukprot:GDKJ01000863.1.p1 GENE.GDKJ01000863.1~~GDKJ01000863.1.p1  ORF type:complete len:255 (-),score=37.08 GDKJ01000863.1:16-780(-)